MKILGIESSCDETACSVVEDGKTVLSNIVASQIDEHRLYGGVVSCDMVNRHKRLACTHGKSLCKAHSHEKCTDKSRSIGHCNSVDVVHCAVCFFKSGFMVELCLR